jgi:hypothetical protein
MIKNFAAVHTQQFKNHVSMCSSDVICKTLQRDAWLTRRRLLIDLLCITENMGKVPGYIKEVVMVED